MVSLFGKKLFYLSLEEIERILRSAYKEITYINLGKVYFKSLYDISAISDLDDIRKNYNDRKTETKEQEPFNIHRTLNITYLF